MRSKYIVVIHFYLKELVFSIKYTNLNTKSQNDPLFWTHNSTQILVLVPYFLIKLFIGPKNGIDMHYAISQKNAISVWFHRKFLKGEKSTNLSFFFHFEYQW